MSTTHEAPTAQREPDSPSHQSERQPAAAHDGAAPASGFLQGAFGEVIGNPILRHPASGSVRNAVMRRTQQHLGNRATQQLVAQLRRSTLQRSCQCGGTCEQCRQAATPVPTEAEEMRVQRSTNGGGGKAPPADSGSAPSNMGESQGQPMDDGTRGFMESRFGRDFADVRVHTDSAAAGATEDLQANAFTTGSDVFFGEGKYQPDTREGRHLIAHELTHVAQQSDGATPSSTVAMDRSGLAVGHPDDPLEYEAERAADEVAGSSSQPPSLSNDSAGTVRRDIKSGAKALWNATGGRAADYVGKKVENAAEGTKEWFMAQIENYAPGLLKLLQGGAVDYLKEQITSGLDSVFGGIVSKIQKEGFLGAAAGIIGELTTSIGKAASGLLANACASFAHAAEAVTSFAKSIVGPAIDGIKKALSVAGDFFSGLWKDIGAPVWDAIKSVAGAVWTWIEGKAKWIWDKTATVRAKIGAAWNWLKKQFGLMWDSEVSIFDWFKDKAKAAWDKVYDFTKPIHGPLKVIGGILLILSPMGPIILIWKGAPVLWDALTWLYTQWKKTDFIVAARNVLTEHILPAIASGAQMAAGLLEAASTWISEKVDTVNTALNGLLDALGVSALLKIAKSAVQFVADAFRKFATWVKNDFFKTLNKIKEVLLKILEFVKPILTFLLKLAIVVANPLLLPIVITGYLWQALPSCFKPPIVDFILDLLIAAVRAIPTWKVLGDAWPPAKVKILDALTELRLGDVEAKIAASNRVARIMSGDDLAWLGNLFSAMVQVPDHIEGQFEEELIGMNLTEPLPFERAAPPGADGAASQAVAMGALPAEDATLLSNAHLTADQIGVTQVAGFEPERELVEELRAGGGEKEYRGAEDPSRTIAGVQAELNGDAPPATAGGQGDVDAAAAPQGGPTAEMSTDEQLEMMMNQPAPDTCSKEKPAPETGSAVPENMKIGPLTRGQRARYLLHQIGQGIKQWFNCNASWLIPSIIGVIALLVGLEILTGGAVTAALPSILDIFAAIMIGVAAVRAAAYMAEYVGKAITGDIAGAAKSLARGLAIIGIELIFALLFNLDKVIKSLKQGLKATMESAAKAAKAAVKGTIESVENLGRIGLKGAKTAGRNIAGFGRAIVKNGKLLLEGVGEGFARGIRKVEELFKRLWNKLRFKAFRIRLSGAWFRLEGEINPWVLLAEGKVQWLEEGAVDSKGARAVVGSEVQVGGKTGLIIGKDEVPSALVKLLDHPPPGMGPGFSEEVRDLFYDALRRARAAGQTPNLRQLLQQASIDVLKSRSGSVVESILDGFRRAGIPEGHLDQLLHNLMNETRSVLAPENMLGRLNQLARMNPMGLDRLIADLAAGGNKLVGAEWAIRFVTESPGARVSAIRAFEEAAAGGGRVYDIVMNGVHYELKNWAKFSEVFNESFMREVIHDFKQGLLPNGMKWVFAPRIGAREGVLKAMRAALKDSALRQAVKMSADEAKLIDSMLEGFVSVGL